MSRTTTGEWFLGGAEGPTGAWRIRRRRPLRRMGRALLYIAAIAVGAGVGGVLVHRAQIACCASSGK